MNKDYSKHLVKEYEHWLLQVHGNQGYLGRCVVMCKRPDAQDLTDATPEEQNELFLILRKTRKALTKAFSPDWFNYSFLGNELPHLHGHIVPRYRKPATFVNVQFEDTLFGKHYKTDHSFVTAERVLVAVRDEIKKYL